MAPHRLPAADMQPPAHGAGDRQAAVQPELSSSMYDALEDLIQPKGPSFRDFFNVMKKRRRSFWVTAGAVFSLAFVYCLLSMTQYTAVATVEVGGYYPTIGGTAVEDQFEADSRKLVYQTTTGAKLGYLSLADEVLVKDNFGAEIQKYVDDTTSPISQKLSSAVKWITRRLFGGDDDAGGGDARFHYNETFLKNYLQMVQTFAVPNTTLVQIQASAGRKRLAQRIANRQAEGLVQRLNSEHVTELQAHLDTLKANAAELQGKLEKAEAEVAKYAEDHQLLTFAGGAGAGSLMISRLTELDKLLAAAQAERAAAAGKFTQTEQPGETESTLFDDQTVKDLRTQLKLAESDYASLSQMATGQYPKLVELHGKIDSLRRNIEQERKHNASAVRLQYDSAVSSEKLLEKQFADELTKAHEMSAQLVQYNLLQSQASSLRELTQTVLKSFNEMAVNRNDNRSSAFVSDYAPVPQLPAQPRRFVILVLGAILGVMAGVGVAVFREVIDNTIKVSDDAQTALALPLLGIIPSFRALGARELIDDDGGLVRRMLRAAARHFSRARSMVGRASNSTPKQPVTTHVASDESLSSVSGAIRSEPDASDEAAITLPPAEETDQRSPALPEAGILDAFWTLRANILFSSTQNRSRVIMVASSCEREGKTSVITNLAITFARAGQKTLLIDGDLRRPRIAHRFRIPPDQPGLVDLLAEQASLEEVVVDSPVDNLMLIPAGSLTVTPTKLLGSDKMGQLIGALRQQFDIVLIDAAPVLAVADSLMLAQFAETVIYVVRSGETEKAVAQEGIMRLRRVGARVRGLVLNDFNPGSGGYSPDEYSVSRYKLVIDGRRVVDDRSPNNPNSELQQAAG